MANDPNRDLLPVKEDCCKTGKGFGGKFDHQVLGKLSRCELEDRFLRLLDEQTHIKKLANSQEEKIKRLGTKLLRLINEKKNGKKLSDQNKETEDLHLRIIELEHENYALKDKNTVLKQQLSNHSRQLLTHRSPNRSNHTSPLMTMRQSAAPTHSEIAYDTNKTTAADMQLQEAEAHIRELNEEIKSLHCKIDCLQQNLEKNCLDSRKNKVTENIELIRLQRSLKQQSIQIAALQAQVKNSENNQKLLKEELVKAHNENDEALHLISVKQAEILNLCSKLEEKNLNRLEENELKSRINDLMLERDSLKERSEFLMKSIGAKAEEAEKIAELQKLLAEEKYKKEKLEEELELCKKNIQKVENESPASLQNGKTKTVNRAQQTASPEEKEFINSAVDCSEESECSCSKCNNFMSLCKCSQESFLNPELESDTEPSEPIQEKIELNKAKSRSLGKNAAEKMKLERELQYLREMLRSQTLRCESQQAEINRLMYELKMNEEKCSETLQRLDWHLRIFQTYEMSEFETIMRMKQNERMVKPIFEKPEPVRERYELVRERSERVCERPEPTRERPEPVRERPEPVRERPEPVRERPEPVRERPEPVRERSEPVRERPEPVRERPEPVRERPDPVRERPEPVRERPEPVRERPEPVYERLETTRERPEPTRERSEPSRERFEPRRDKVEKTQENAEVVSEVTIIESDFSFETPRDIAKIQLAKRKQSIREETFSPELSDLSEKNIAEKESTYEVNETEHRNRFVDQKFLDSSDEEFDFKSRIFKTSFNKRKESIDDDDITASKSLKRLDSEDSPSSWNDKNKKLGKSTPVKKISSISWSSSHGSNPLVSTKRKERESRKGVLRYDLETIEKPLSVKINILWFQMEPKCSLWKNKNIEMFFIDFTFLDVNGAETETPNSLPKPKNADEKCYFNFCQTIDVRGIKLEMLNSLLTKRDLTLIVFKLVSDSEKFDETNDECEDIGVAVITVKEFLEYNNKGSFIIPVKNIDNPKELIGTLSVKIETIPEISRS